MGLQSGFGIWIWEPLHGTSLVRPMLKRLQQNGFSIRARGLGFQKDGWSCDYESLHVCDEVAGYQGSLEDIDVILTPLPKDSSKIEALRIINADRSVRVPGTIVENGWEEEVSCWKPGESPPAPASNLSPRPHLLPPSFLMKRILFHNPKAILRNPPQSQKLENLMPPQPPTLRTCP